MKSLRLVVAILTACACCSVASAQQKVPVLVDSTVGEDDSVGRLVVFELREAIRSSGGFELIADAEYRKPKFDGDTVAHVRISVVTIRDDANVSALSVVFVYDSSSTPLRGALMTSQVQTCGANKTVICARRALALLDESVEELRKNRPGFWKNLLVR